MFIYISNALGAKMQGRINGTFFVDKTTALPYLSIANVFSMEQHVLTVYLFDHFEFHFPNSMRNNSTKSDRIFVYFIYFMNKNH